ncbi:MAG: methylated-DNA--[protein]-cysteine S-methyltransferase [Amycolatopsis sp.]|uniref:methylated-DNA--[protein]-cysteine S-methyltransferase n=1 Tax=Amycolatopsis sp. TaxID=37632 RepID=UPI00262C4942|nr:methylated-DNA--[protein]-cysteine S-methyltransferase [Amycolatopsis sp.]MCU1684285.1 methylated-DNA--[protein]-cysteine S-methyltransferase [Amycolatopsis sp.]
MNTAVWSTLDTLAGPFTAVVAEDGAVLASGWTSDVGLLTSLISPGLAPTEITETDDLGEVGDAIRRYHAGELDAVDDIAVRQHSSPFREKAWRVLRTVKPGEPVSYADYATLAGNPAAIRAAASACARNAAALFVPCHRVVRTGGALGGFRWGTETKRWLLDHEAPAK